MTADQFLIAVGSVDDTLLDVCDHIPPDRRAAWKIPAAAACIAVSLLTAFAVLHLTRTPVAPAPDNTTVAAYGTAGTDIAPTTSDDRTDAAQPDETAPDGRTFEVNAPAGAETTAASPPYLVGGGKTQDSDNLPAETVTAADPDLWTRAPITSKYPYLVRGQQRYTSRGNAKPEHIDNRVLTQQPLGRQTLQGFDNDPAHTAQADVFALRDISPDAAVAVRFVDDSKYYTYVCTTYAPRTLGQLTDDLHLQQDCAFTAANGCGGDMAATVFAAPSAQAVWQLFDRSAVTQTDADRHAPVVLIRYNDPLLGYTPGSIGVTADGYLIVNICEREYVYFVGKDRVQTFFAYLNENCAPIRLAEQTSVAYTPRATQTAPEGENE